ncbi:MAG: prepilin peptidase [Patescibacteria group bacterium]|nr:prepilin peptidase [Patescibacteria group bacterium]
MSILYIFIFILGLVAGSFLNVVIYRLETEEKIVNDRSRCPKCKHVLSWLDLFPVFSFLLLKGKCRYCLKKISWQYPLVEIGTGILFVLVAFYFPYFSFQLLSTKLFYLLLIISALIVVSVFDIRHYIIPDKIIFPAIAVSLVYNFVVDFVLNDYMRLDYVFSGNGLISVLFLLLFASQFFNTLVAAFSAFGFFLIIFLLTKGNGMGGGDVKLAFLMGLILGWPLILLAVFLSFIFGSIFGLALIFAGKKKMKSMVPFGPFLVAGTFVSLFWGEIIIKWYFNLFIF